MTGRSPRPTVANTGSSPRSRGPYTIGGRTIVTARQPVARATTTRSASAFDSPYHVTGRPSAPSVRGREGDQGPAAAIDEQYTKRRTPPPRVAASTRFLVPTTFVASISARDRAESRAARW